eukprot:5617915-Pyramimonas_sp.AAC.1
MSPAAVLTHPTWTESLATNICQVLCATSDPGTRTVNFSPVSSKASRVITNVGFRDAAVLTSCPRPQF